MRFCVEKFSTSTLRDATYAYFRLLSRVFRASQGFLANFPGRHLAHEPEPEPWYIFYCISCSQDPRRHMPYPISRENSIDVSCNQDVLCNPDVALEDWSNLNLDPLKTIQLILDLLQAPCWSFSSRCNLTISISIYSTKGSQYFLLA